MITFLTILAAMIVLTAMAISGFVADESPRALVRVRSRRR